MKLRLLLILGALTAFGPLAIDFYLPAFPAMARDFSTDVEHVQHSLAVYFLGLALGQLLYGPLADRFGRRRPLLVGVALFALASLGCAFAASLDQLIALRLLQALGGCAGTVIARAVVRDLCDPLETARTFSRLMLVMGLAPILAPTAGGLLLEVAGWQAIFVVLGLFAVICWLAVYFGLPESLPVEARAVDMSRAVRSYLGLLRDAQFMGQTLTGGLAMAAMFAYIAGSPFVFIELYGVSAEHYGWVFGSNALGFIAVSQFNTRLLLRHGPAYWVPRTAALYAGLALVLLLVALAQPASLWVLWLPLFCAIATLGALLPNASSCAMAGQGARAGSAAALMGSLQFAIAALAAAAVSWLHDGTVRPMVAVMFVSALAAMLMALLTARQAGQAA